MSRLKTPVDKKDHVQGPDSAPIELVEYGDYQCPHCGRAYPIIKDIQARLGKKLKFVFRNFPLSEAHPNAEHAAIAAEAAGAQGKFWEMHDMIFENQESLEDSDLVDYAKKIGLNIAKFETDFEKPEFSKKVASDFEDGIRSGVNGTPSFFINGEKYDGDWEENHFLTRLKKLSV
jgi:protein-disulfide isomerase